MKPVEMVVLVLTITTILLSTFFIWEGIRRKSVGREKFYWRHLFEKKTFEESPGKLLVVEGLIGIGIILVFNAVFWIKMR